MRRAFTLIELLVVVSIIALLVATLLPVLSNVKYAARTTICTTRLQQIGIGTTAYAAGNNGNGAGYHYADTTTGNANYLYDDGSVVMEGQIYN